uniref:Uncharacterized protein n=1 Tax=Romanomermis culicivorax TaxID=13658 RepID=A0A915II40_ROMCU
MASNMKHFKFTIPMPANTTVSSYIQLAFPSRTMIVFETFTTTPEDWTALFSNRPDRANDWVGIYALLGTQFCTDRQKKNKDPVMKVIHFNAYCVTCNIAISPPIYELAQRTGFIPEERTLKAMVSAMWAFNVSWLMLKFPAMLRFFNNHHSSFLQLDVLSYGALDAFYPILLFLAFG